MAEENTLEVRIGGDVEGFVRAANAARKTLDDFEKRVAQSTSNIDGSAKRSADAQAKYLTELAKRYDPAIRAQERYAKSIADINLLVKANVYTEQQATQALTRALAERTNAIQRASGAQEAAFAAGARASRGFGSAIQQAGFQVGDFAVQVASGQGVLRPFIQQGTQLISMFGPWGAVIGAAGAVVGALAATFLDLEKGTSEADEAAKSYEDTLKSLQAVIDELDGKGKTRIEKLREEVNEQKQLVRVEIAKTQALVDQARVRAEVAQLSDPETAFGVGNAELERIKRLQRVIDEAQKRIDKLDEKYMEAANAVYNDEQVEKTRKAVEDLTKAEQKRLEIIRQYDLDRVLQQEKDRAAAQERGRKIIEEDQKAREKAIEDVRRAQAKADEERLRAAERYAEQLERTTERVLDNISEAGGDILFDAWEGKVANFWETFTRFGKRALAQLAAEQITQSLFRPIISPVVSVLPGMFGISGSTPSGGQIAGTANAGPGLFDVAGLGLRLAPDSWFSGITSSIDAFGASYLGLNSAAAAQAAASTYGISAGQAAALSNAGALGSTASLSGILGAAGLGFAGGSLLASLTGGNAVGGGIGGGIGAGAGFLIGGPVGAILGGLGGSLLGGLFGRKKKFQGGHTNINVDPKTGLLTVGSTGARGVDPNVTIQQSQQAVQQINALLQAYELRATRGGFIGQGMAPGPQSAEAFIAQLISGRAFRSDDPVFSQILGASKAKDLQGLAGDLDFGKLYKTMSELQRPVNALRDGFEAMSKQFDEATKKAGELGLSVSKLREGTAANFNQEIERAIQGIIDPLGLALDDFAEVAEARLEYARKIGADIVEVERLNMLERQRILDQSGANLKQWLENQIIGPTSSLTGSGRLAEAQKQFGAAVSAARAGTGGIGDVTRLGDIILGMSQELYGGTKQNAVLVEMVRSTIANLGKDLGYPGFAEGTTSAPAGWAWVGERGPELVRFRGGEQVVPAEQSAQMARSQAVSSALMADEMQSMRRDFARLTDSMDSLHRDFRKILNRLAAA